ncbi:MAG TPA: FHA domain-containing protein [Blastocatellia bacterium]|nr:FHA domain-containing protein [Blastocatellia bacterium]
MIRCNNCGTNNIDGSEYCDECGMKLDLVAQPRARGGAYQPPSAVESDPVPPNTNEGPPIAPPSFTTSTSIPKPAMPARERKPEGRGEKTADGNSNRRRNVTDERRAFNPGPRESHPTPDPPRANGPSQTFALSSRVRTDAMDEDYPSPSADNPRVTARLIIERGGRVGREFTITGIETNIGRWDADSGIFPDVDLDEDDPEAKISRRHARIINHNGQYFIEDLGSTNGTFVNRGRRLLPGKRHMLQNGDEIIVGKTFLKFQILR